MRRNRNSKIIKIPTLEQRSGRPIAVMLDLQGPKLRLRVTACGEGFADTVVVTRGATQNPPPARCPRE